MKHSRQRATLAHRVCSETTGDIVFASSFLSHITPDPQRTDAESFQNTGDSQAFGVPPQLFLALLHQDKPAATGFIPSVLALGLGLT